MRNLGALGLSLAILAFSVLCMCAVDALGEPALRFPQAVDGGGWFTTTTNTAWTFARELTYTFGQQPSLGTRACFDGLACARKVEFTDAGWVATGFPCTGTKSPAPARSP